MTNPTYPFDVAPRYTVRTGKWGQYFHDDLRDQDLNLEQVRAKLDLLELRTQQLRWYVEKFGEQPKP